MNTGGRAVGDAAPQEIAWQRLDPRARVLFYLQAFTSLALFWVPVTVGAVIAASWWWELAPALILGGAWLMIRLVVAIWLPSLAYARWAWALRDEDLLITRGVFFRSVTAIPAGRIQHVDTRQGPIEQWLGLARVQVYTASGAGADGVIPGLELPVAVGLRDRLVRERGDDGV